MTTKRERRAAVYMRISKDRANEASIDIQTETATRYAEGKGWTVAETYIDRGKSAYKGTPRPALDRLLADVDAGRVDVVVVYRLDRLARSVRDFTSLWETLKDGGAEFVSVSEAFDTTTAMGKAMLQIASVFAELESGIKSERITDWHNHRTANGAAPTGPRAFGYGPGRAIVKAEADIIRTAAQAVLDGRSLRDQVARLNDAGITTALGGTWSSRGLRHVLMSPHTAGLRVVDGVLVDGTWPGILTRAEHEQIAALMNNPSRRTTTGPGRRHLLTGIATCGLCGTPLAGKPHVAGPRYLCAPRKGHPGCGRLSIDAAKADLVVTEMVLAALDPATVERAAARWATDPAADVERLEHELQETAADYGAGRITRDEWQTIRAGIEDRMTSAQNAVDHSRLAGLVHHLRDGDLGERFAALDLADQRAVLLAVLERVDIGPAGGGGVFDPSRVVPMYRA